MEDRLKEGKKYDGSKLRMELIPYDSLIEVAKVITVEHKASGLHLRFDKTPFAVLIEVAKIFTFGAGKYEDNNWRKGIKWSRIFGALIRHATAWYLGENNDPEQDISHLAACIWVCLIIINFTKTRKDFDDRIVNDFSTLLPEQCIHLMAECSSSGGDLESELKSLKDKIKWSSTFRDFMEYSWRWYLGEDYDKKTGLHNMAYAAYYCMTLLECQIKNFGIDDRVVCKFNMSLPEKAIKFLKKFKELQESEKEKVYMQMKY